MSILLSILLALSLTSGVMLASSQATPGDVTYSVKRFKEDIQLGLAASTEAEAKAYAEQAAARIDEYTKLRTEFQAHLAAGNENGTDAEAAVVQLANERYAVSGAQQLAGSTTVQALIMLSSAQADLEARHDTEASASLQEVSNQLKARAIVASLDISAAGEASSASSGGTTTGQASGDSGIRLELQGLAR